MLMGKEERRGVRSIFQPTFGFNGGLERSARTRFRGCRFGSLSQSLVSQLPVRLLTINRGQGERKGRRRVSIGNTLTAEVSLDFIVPKGHSVKVVRLPSFVRTGRRALCGFVASDFGKETDQAHSNGNHPDQRPTQKRASGDRAGDNPNAKGNDSY
jgi:hypothetical protein